MASNTSYTLRDLVIYSVYVRNHTEEGTFRAVIPDLDRIKSLGTDIVWFMPIHPIGVMGKKGSLGCPYANQDYRSVNPEYGTMDDFKLLVDEIHKRGMKCMIDVVYNHTSPDSVLTESHPEFFYRKADGSMGNHVGDWSDVVDLDYNCRALWDYQKESLVMWAKIVDGFRCDVASFVPVEFWKEARSAVEKVNPDCIWLAETVHSGFGRMCRQIGMYSANDYDMFAAFDLEYDYDVREVFDRYLTGQANLSNYIDVLNFQECLYPMNYNKMRCLENHDQPRIASFVTDSKSMNNWNSFLFFLKGSTLIYAGQEYMCSTVPSLFEKDVFVRNQDLDISRQLAALAEKKRTILSCEDSFTGKALDQYHIAVLERSNNKTRKLGIFSLKGLRADVSVNWPDGSYENHLDHEMITIKDGVLHCDGDPVWLSMPEIKKDTI